MKWGGGGEILKLRENVKIVEEGIKKLRKNIKIVDEGIQELGGKIIKLGRREM